MSLTRKNKIKTFGSGSPMSRNTVNCLLVVIVFVLLCQVALLVSKLSKPQTSKEKTSQTDSVNHLSMIPRSLETKGS